MKPYPDYFITPLPWLPNIPAHWELVRNKNIFEETKDVVGDDIDAYPLLSLTTKGIILHDVASGKGKFPKDFNTYKIVKPGDMAFCLFDIDETPRTVGLSQYNGMLTGAYTIFHVANINPHYAYYYYLSLDNVKAMRPLYSGLRKTINTGTFLSCKLPLPPRPEQDQIVRFLDWKVSSINKLIGVNQKQIECLNEKLLTVVNDLLTHGVKQNRAYMKTNMDWASEIPLEWEISRVRNHFEILKRIAGSEGFDVFSVTQQGLKVRNINLYEGQLAANYSGYQFVYPGEFAMNHMDLLTGGVGIADHLGVTSPDYRVFRLFDEERCYAAYYLKIFQLCYRRHAFYRFGRGAANVGRWRLPASAFKNFEIPLPPYDEQIEIVRAIEIEEHKIKTVIDCLQQEIDVLKEFKKRLIADVVTGKIDVRGIEIPEYDLVEEDSDGESEENTESMEGEMDEE